MSVQKFKISKQGQGFTSVPNKVIQGLVYDTALLGFYLYLCSLPEGWEFHKNHLRETCNLGINRLNEMLRKLAQHGLINIQQQRNEVGQFSFFDMQVFDGIDFIPIPDLRKSNRCMKTVATVAVTRQTAPIKEINKKEINTKEIDKNYCATDVAPKRFEEFWFTYPRKKDKKRAEAIWQREKLDQKADEIIKDVKNRLLNDQQWKDDQYIPHPTTYLKFERWNDEVTLISLPTSQSKFNAAEYALNKIKSRQKGKLL